MENVKKNQDILKHNSPPGHGEIVIEMSSGTGVKPSFSKLRASYPLKFLSPKTYTPYLAAVYVLTYGGGMVSGDKISISVECHKDVNLMLLTQGSTKIYKKRQTSNQINNNINGDNDKSETMQNLNVVVQKNSLVLQLPEPTTCFRASEFIQHQKYFLENHTSSVIVLDWFTSGRMSRGERWEFLKYKSSVDIFVNNNLVFRDVVLLKQNFDDYLSSSSFVSKEGYAGENKIHNNNNNSSSNRNSIKDCLEPYDCFAMLVLYGPKVIPLMNNIIKEFDKIVVDKANKVPDLIWSASELNAKQYNNDNNDNDDDDKNSDFKGLVLKVAGVTTEIVRNFLINVALKDLDELIGENLFKRAL